MGYPASGRSRAFVPGRVGCLHLGLVGCLSYRQQTPLYTSWVFFPRLPGHPALSDFFGLFLACSGESGPRISSTSLAPADTSTRSSCL